MSIAHKIEYDKAILEIDADIIDLTWAGELMKYETFRSIHSHASDYVTEALKLFRNAEGKTQVRRIVALSMQRLPLEDYLLFLRSVLYMLHEGHISVGEFKNCCFPSYEWNTTLAEQYSHMSVQVFLQDLIGSYKLPEELKTFIRDHIISGKAYHQIQYLRRVGEIA